MNKKEKFFEKLQGRTNINNTTYNNNANDILTTSMIVPSGNNQKEVNMTSSPFGQEEKGGVSPQVKLPPTWFGVKFDLFNNAGKLKLKMGVMLLKDKSHVNLVASLNSPTRMMYRGTQDFDEFEQHWKTVKGYEKFLKNQKIDYRCSKLIQPGKKGSISNMACFVWLDHYWNVAILREGHTYNFELTDNTSDRFKKSNGIATLYVGGGKTKTKGIKCQDLGL